MGQTFLSDPRCKDRFSMVDPLTREHRSCLMSNIRRKDTGPELVVRSLLWSLGFRFRLHAGELPSKPDVVNRRRRVAIFVHGCFWHAHACKYARTPKSNLGFWVPKLARTRARDQSALSKLRTSGWNATVVWECEIRNMAKLRRKLDEFLKETAIKSRGRSTRGCRAMSQMLGVHATKRR